MIGRGELHNSHRLLRKERVGCQARHKVDRKANERSVSGEDILAGISLVADQFSDDLLREVLAPERLPVIDMTGMIMT